VGGGDVTEGEVKEVKGKCRERWKEREKKTRIKVCDYRNLVLCRHLSYSFCCLDYDKENRRGGIEWRNRRRRW